MPSTALVPLLSMPATPSVNTAMSALIPKIPTTMPTVIPEKTMSGAAIAAPLNLCLRYKPSFQYCLGGYYYEEDFCG